MPAESFDAIVVGGGLAGVTAARDLAQSGLRTLLVEARDRLGGRTASQRIAGRTLDTGGAYFHWFQSAIWREISRYELPVEESGMGHGRYLLGTRDGIEEMSIEDFDGRLRKGLAAFWGDPAYAAAVPRPFALQTDPDAAKLDQMSIEDRLQELGLDPQIDDALRAMFGDYGDPNDASLGWLLQRMSNGVWSYAAHNALYAVYRLKCGMAGLIDAMVREGGFNVRLSSPVSAVEHDDDGATVVLEDGSELSARVVVVATPVSLWSTITFTPELSEAHQAATSEGVAIPTVTSMLMQVRGVTEPFVMLSSFGDQPFEIFGTHTEFEDGGQLLFGISVDGSVTCAGGHEQIQKALHSIMPEVELVDFVGHDWSADSYARGGYAALRPGQLTRFVDVLDQPVGAMFFATADIAPQFSGTLTGAVESGARAARRATLAVQASSN
jgi:monoamine oxidase